MATILYAGSHGPVDPTRATLPFILARGALEAGHRPQIALLTEAPLVLKAEIQQRLTALGFPPLRELLPGLVEHQVPIFV